MLCKCSTNELIPRSLGLCYCSPTNDNSLIFLLVLGCFNFLCWLPLTLSHLHKQTPFITFSSTTFPSPVKTILITQAGNIPPLVSSHNSFQFVCIMCFVFWLDKDIWYIHVLNSLRHCDLAECRVLAWLIIGSLILFWCVCISGVQWMTE
jgi:hypothetical protein